VNVEFAEWNTIKVLQTLQDVVSWEGVASKTASGSTELIPLGSG
tara:strand:- start:389 stop:520 length:132 start_codon:yes stop_codon:yes gene_type:complete